MINPHSPFPPVHKPLPGFKSMNTPEQPKPVSPVVPKASEPKLNKPKDAVELALEAAKAKIAAEAAPELAQVNTVAEINEEPLFPEVPDFIPAPEQVYESVNAPAEALEPIVNSIEQAQEVPEVEASLDNSVAEAKSTLPSEAEEAAPISTQSVEPALAQEQPVASPQTHYFYCTKPDGKQAVYKRNMQSASYSYEVISFRKYLVKQGILIDKEEQV